MSHVSRRRVGDALVTIIHEGDGRWAPQLQAPEADWRAAMPEADAAGVVGLDFSSVHVALGDASLLVDCCFDDPAPGQPWEAMMGLRRTPGLEAGLALIGVRPEAITHVVVSHPHGDHLAGVTVERGGRRVARFPNARHLINRLDWEPARGRTIRSALRRSISARWRRSGCSIWSTAITRSRRG